MSLFVNHKGFSSTYQADFTVIRVLASSKFPIYLVKSQWNSKICALKVFPLEDGKVSSHYVRETAISNVSHPNIISIHHQKGTIKSFLAGGSKRISYVLMEYAPYGDFCDLITSNKLYFDDKLVRTYFHQLMGGLEHLHACGIHHLDLKPENLLLGENFQLKIADFDLCHVEGDEKILAHGTRFHRAPELASASCANPSAADIFSAGIFLFNLKYGGQIPQMEDQACQGVNLFDIMQTEPQKFWEWHAQFQGKGVEECFDKDFRDLFLGMTRLFAGDRMSINQIKESKWYNGPIYTKEELNELLAQYFN